MANDVFNIKQGDLLPPLTGTIQSKSTGAPQDLTGATLAFHMRDRAGTVVVNAPASIDGDPTLGKFRYNWVAGDTDDAGTFEGEIQATIAGKPLTGPNTGNFRVRISREIA